MNWFDYQITHGYYPNAVLGIADTPHRADDLATPMDTPVWFWKSGKIVQEDHAYWNNAAGIPVSGGGEIFLQPDDGSPEEYFYHLDKFQPGVNIGNHVDAGQVVGFSGGQNSGGNMPTDPFWSSGPHLHVGYFTGYSSGRPDGPDVTPTLQSLKTGQTVLPNAGDLSSLGNLGSLDGITSDPSTWLNSISQSLHVFFLRYAVFSIAIVLIGFGLWIAFPRQAAAVGAAAKKSLEAAV